MLIGELWLFSIFSTKFKIKKLHSIKTTHIWIRFVTLNQKKNINLWGQDTICFDFLKVATWHSQSTQPSDSHGITLDDVHRNIVWSPIYLTCLLVTTVRRPHKPGTSRNLKVYKFRMDLVLYDNKKCPKKMKAWAEDFSWRTFISGPIWSLLLGVLDVITKTKSCTI